MKVFFASCLVLLLSGGVFAQNAPTPAYCANDLFSHIVRTHHPELARAFDATFEAARQPQASPRGPLTVNVVVHVVWKDAAENLADDVIYDQIAILNADFNRQNADTANLRPMFQPVAGNADIHFQLAAIERVQTTELFEIDLLGTDLLTNLKHSAQGGSDAWDTEHYLNIWVCKIQPLSLGPIVLGQAFGFAFPPNNLDNWPDNSGAPSAEEDGVVIDFRAFGSNNPNPAEIPGLGTLTIKGRTPVHEVGHYFGLRHIWGDGGAFGPNDCAQSDGIDDTPFANAQSNFDCDASKNSCEQVETFYGTDMPDLIENFMDYSSEDCENMFTKGQVALMRNVLAGPRSGLIESVGAIDPPAGAGWRIFPNPASENATIALHLPEKSEVGLRVFGADGRLAGSKRFAALSAGEHQIKLELPGMTPGIYFVEMNTVRGTSLQKLVIE